MVLWKLDFRGYPSIYILPILEPFYLVKTKLEVGIFGLLRKENKEEKGDLEGKNLGFFI